MEKRKLSVIQREEATDEMIDIAGRLTGTDWFCRAKLVLENKILLLTFYRIKDLAQGKRKAVFRTFLSQDDYITQDLTVSNTKWRTASFCGMYNFSLFDYVWKNNECIKRENIFIYSTQEQELIAGYFKEYAKQEDSSVWNSVCCFQNAVLAKRLEQRHKKETDPIDELMKTVNEPPESFKKWAFETAMGFSRYLIYSAINKNTAECECTYCKTKSIVNRNEIRLRNNEKGVCPFCGSKVTYKAKGKLPYRINDERWVAYVDPTSDGFLWRYFHVWRTFERDNKMTVEDTIREYSRVFYTFENGKYVCDSYEYAEYKASGKIRWCHDEGKVMCGLCVLYPENLPAAWEHTPMKSSALEILSRNMPTTSLHYEWGIQIFLDFPALEWLSKMGLNKLAADIINNRSTYGTAEIDKSAKTIYEILNLNKVNTRILQVIDGNHDVLRLLQAAEKIGLNFKPEKLKDYYETFGCNTALLNQANRKVTLHKLVKYITRESENYPMRENGGCWRYAYNRYYERKDPRIERKQNMATDWLEYLEWCKALKYDTDNMFVYMPKNFKKVHDRTAKEYQTLLDKKAAAKKKKQETLAKKRLKETQKAMAEIFKNSEGTDAFSIKGRGLVLVVPKCGDEIRLEGEALHHCVGSYIDEVARGETNIFFVRKADEPEVPYFTMEYRANKVVQCRGLRNCGMPPDVQAFVNVFEKKMQEAAEKARVS